MSYPYPPAGQPYGAPPPPPPGYGPPGYGPPPKPKRSPLKTAAIVVASVAALFAFAIVVAATVPSPKPNAGRPAAAVGATDPAPETAPGDDEPAGEPEETEPSTFDLKPGTTITLTSDDSVQEWTLTSWKWHKGGCGGLSDAEKGGYLVATVRVVQKSGVGSSNALFFEHVSEDGVATNSLSAMFSGCEKDNLQSTNSLRAGQKRSGQVAFDVKSPKGTVELQPGLAEDTAGSWKVG